MNKLALLIGLLLSSLAIHAQVHGDITTETGHLITIDDLVLSVDPTNAAPLSNAPCPYTQGELQAYLNCMAANYPLQGVGQSYNLVLNKDFDYLNGVSTLDLILVQRHINRLELLGSPYKVLAADVNDDYKVNADLSIIGVKTGDVNNSVQP